MDTIPVGLPELLEKLHRKLASQGFSRVFMLRRIRMPGNGPDFMELWWSSESSWASDDPFHPSSIRLAIGKETMSRIREYDGGSRYQDLQYTITLPSNPSHEPGDPAQLLWDEMLGIHHSNIRVELPIFCWSRLAEDKGNQTRGIVIAENPSPKSGQLSMHRPSLELIQKDLRSIVVEISQTMQRAFDRRREEMMERIHEFYAKHAPKAASEHTAQDFLETFLEFACDVSQAGNATISWSQNTILLPIAMGLCNRQKEDRAVVSAIGDPLSVEKSPASFDSWRDQKPKFYNSYVNEEWYGGKAHSRIALPLLFGEKCYGAIGFAHPQPNHFSSHIVGSLERLIDLCLFPIYFSSDKLDRYQWEIRLMHELRTAAMEAETCFTSITNRHPGIRRDKEFHFFQAAAMRVKDMTMSFKVLQSEAVEAFGPPQDPENYVGSVVSDLSPGAKYLGRPVVRVSKTTGVQVAAPDGVMSFVIRNLVHNAIRHGEKKERPVLVRTTTECNFWVIEVENQGQMTKEEDQLKLEPRRYPRTRNRDGSRMALAAIDLICKRYGGRLSVENIKGSDRVLARFSWPIITDQAVVVKGQATEETGR